MILKNMVVREKFGFNASIVVIRQSGNNYFFVEIMLGIAEFLPLRGQQNGKKNKKSRLILNKIKKRGSLDSERTSGEEKPSEVIIL